MLLKQRIQLKDGWFVFKVALHCVQYHVKTVHENRKCDMDYKRKSIEYSVFKIKA